MEQATIKSVDYGMLVIHAQELSDKIKESGLTFNGVYAVPSGGLVPGYIVSVNLDIPLLTKPREGCIIVDDLCDSGSTLKSILQEFIEKGVGVATAVLYKKKSSAFNPSFSVYEIDNDWIELPHESGKVSGVETNITRLLQYLGEDVTREGLQDTPKRVVKAWKEMTSGYERKFEDEVTVFEGEGYDQIVLLKNIEFTSNCEHHMLSFSGKAHIAYLPNKKIVGISKLARVVDIYSKRLQNQERITKQVADCLTKHLDPQGVAVILEAQHSCMKCRGVKKQNSSMVTSMLLGAFRDDASARQELFSLINVIN